MGVMIPLVLANKWKSSLPRTNQSHVASSQEELLVEDTATSSTSEESLRRINSEILNHRSLCSEQGAGLRGSEGIITRGDPDQERVLGGILQTEVSQLSSSHGHLYPPDTGL